MKAHLRPVKGNIFESRAQTLVNTVNTVGVMGKGLALEFRKRFPDMYEDYVRRTREGRVKLGEPYVFKRLVPPWILVFPTKEHWRSVSRLADIVAGLKYVEHNYLKWGVTSLAVPPLGCGLGQLEWRVVGPTLYRHLDRLAIPVELYVPFGTSAEEMSAEFLGQPSEAQLVESARDGNGEVPVGVVVALEVLRRINRTRYHWPIGRVAFQKLLYFATRAGLETRLQFRRASFGPHSEDLKPLLTKLVNNGLVEEHAIGSGRMFRVEVGPTFEDARRRNEAVIAANEPAITQLVDLFCRIRSTHQAELIATVDFARRTIRTPNDAKPTEKDVLEEVMEWKRHARPKYDENEVALVVREMAALGVLDVSASPDLRISGDPGSV